MAGLRLGPQAPWPHRGPASLSFDVSALRPDRGRRLSRLAGRHRERPSGPERGPADAGPGRGAAHRVPQARALHSLDGTAGKPPGGVWLRVALVARSPDLAS